MKKLLLFAVAVSLVLTLSACSKKTYEIALITDVGTVTDKSFNQGAWEGVEKYAKEFDKTYKYYQPSDQNTDEYMKMIKQAVDNGAKIIVTPGFFFSNTIWLAQDKYPDVKFILLDAEPNNVTNWDTDPWETMEDADPSFTQNDNVLSIYYTEHESGFLAGYAAVKDGFTELGFMGGKAVPAVVKFGFGFIQGANYAAAEMDITVNINYTYLGGFGPDAAFQSKAATWYSEGTEVIFAAAGGAGGSVMKAAEQENGFVIGVDSDQADQSTTVITSAMKQLAPSVYESLKLFYADEFPGGTVALYNANNDGVKLPDNFSRFTDFTAVMYAAIFEDLQDGTVVVDDESGVAVDVFAVDYTNVVVTPID